jgi:hypothetical protein
MSVASVALVPANGATCRYSISTITPDMDRPLAHQEGRQLRVFELTWSLREEQFLGNRFEDRKKKTASVMLIGPLEIRVVIQLLNTCQPVLGEDF